MFHDSPKTVICVGKDTVDAVLDEIETINQFSYADIIELRTDYIREEDLSVRNLARIKNASDKEVLFTLRKQEEGGQRYIAEAVREAFYLAAIGIGCEYVDIENSTSKDMLDRIMKSVKTTKGSTRLILSFHNFNETLESEILEKFNDIKSKNPDIIKIVTMANSETDSNFVIDFLRRNIGDSIRLVLFCMGEYGKANRIHCHNSGSALTYLAVERGTGTASGQLPYNEFVANPDIEKNIV